MKDLKAAYRTIEADHFAPKMEISFITGDRRETLRYEKVTWNIGGERRGSATARIPDRRPRSTSS